MWKLNPTQEEVNAAQLAYYKHGYYDRGRHLLILYMLVFGTALGMVIEHLGKVI